MRVIVHNLYSFTSFLYYPSKLSSVQGDLTSHHESVMSMETDSCCVNQDEIEKVNIAYPPCASTRFTKIHMK